VTVPLLRGGQVSQCKHPHFPEVSNQTRGPEMSLTRFIAGRGTDLTVHPESPVAQ
jgi:hypothetical protein